MAATAPTYCDACGVEKAGKQCSRCHQARYCSAACQKRHWHASHKNDCATWVAIERIFAADMSARPRVPPDVHCYLCLESGNDLVHCGCRCRGSAGYAHVGCVLEMLSSLGDDESLEEYAKVYDACPTCGGHFTGEMQSQIIVAWWRRNQKPKSKFRYSATIDVTAFLSYRKADPRVVDGIFRRLLDEATREFGPVAFLTLTTLMHLGEHRVQHLGDVANGLECLSRAVAGLRLYSPSSTLADALVMRGRVLCKLGIHDEAVPEAREAWKIAVAAGGEDSDLSFSVFAHFVEIARRSSNRKAYEEIEAVAVDVYTRARRFLGHDNPVVFHMRRALGELRSKFRRSS
ncbi:hypothetical protein CTAYLR_003836 [Chrysophaeum taylorii]|uniref:MYND-type domain-containing protein n=1 Tax=Chrysophaeum taylorii TaxID=2483200 RepID=A0AAD7UDX8_9STRA|nr:hypothetical protein CTAYLR_003836 [Chrysophaeum taylorii]